ncbi:MAG: peptidoglycan DD-metalloendopeptidase family protein [Candidatus Paceibacterota bacterium]
MKQLFLSIGLFLFFTSPVFAQSVDELRLKIEEQTKKIQKLEKEIGQYQNEIEGVQKEADTLQGAIKELDITSRQLQTDISATQSKITRANLNIEALEIEIRDKERKMKQHMEAMANSIRRLYELEAESFIETLIATSDLSEFWQEVAELERFQSTIQGDLEALREARKALASTVEKHEGEKQNLVSFRAQLADKRTIVEGTKTQKDDLLDETKNEEARYKELLAEKLRQKVEFESQLNSFEADLQIAIDPDSFPNAGNTVFAWPLDNIRITQSFGGTEFAAQNPHVYGRPFHNGTDFGALVGTPLKAVLSGTIRATGNTDAISGCYSYGKWILLDHPNGLSTLYAHLSLIRSVPGQKVKTREIIGYTGNTGYSTGPHLHLTTYVSKAVEVVRFGNVKKVTNCGAADIPVAPHNGYLDPLSYLPAL